MDLTLSNFIIYYFLQINMKELVSFNCWDMETQMVFYKMVTDNAFYIEAININNSQAIQGIQYRLWGKKPTMGIFMDLNCESSEALLDIASRERLFNDHFFWLIYDDLANVTYFRALFSHINLAVDAELTYANLNSIESASNSSSFSAFTLYDVYNNGYYYGGKLNMTLDRELYCTEKSCEVNRYLSKLHLRSKYGNRNQLHDMTLRLAVVVTKVPLTATPEEIFTFLRSVNDTSKDAIPRFGYQVLSILVDFLGCKSNHTFTNRWTINETHGGLIGALAVQSADLISTPLIPTPPRMEFFTIIAETSSFRSICLFRTPRNSGIQGDVFLKPFNTTVWLLFGLLLLLTAVVLWSIFRLERKRMHQRYVDYMPSILATFLISFGSACAQGSEMVPGSIGGRIVFLTLYLLTFLMYNYYTSIVVSSLLGSPVKSDIKTMGQLADSPLEVGLDPLPFTLTYLNNSPLPEVRRFKRKIDSAPNPQAIWMPLKDGILRVRDQPGFVFGFEASTGYLLVKRYYKPYEICDLNEILFRPEKSLFSAVHKNSSFKELTKQRIFRILETGVSLKLHRYWVQSSLECFDSNFIVEVGMEYMAPLFMLLLCTYFLVLFILLLEIVHKKYWVDRKLRLENIIFGDNWHNE
ncbi:ionotropic receptor 75a-like [Rhagoletis pomonella]|uniref:ionotropic receptor 75a-like n=1 Tax=Rhagoletis pomonella TaxID=28610 RepID=UPI0017843984|nr:ionotropic receptor 75a-like [Rhagoletis pomonella]